MLVKKSKDFYSLQILKLSLVMFFSLNISAFAFDNQFTKKNIFFLNSVQKNSKKTKVFLHSTHIQLVNTALDNVLRDLEIRLQDKELRKLKQTFNQAHLYQDIFFFFFSKTHFDNCCFAESIEQINQHLMRIESDYFKFAEAIEPKEKQKLKQAIIFRTGRILHSVQDFFSHSNYVELMEKKYQKIDEVPVLDFWTKTGQEEILKLTHSGLISERFFFSFPHKCPPNSPGETQLGKDKEQTLAGKRKTNWLNTKKQNNISGFEAAILLAEKSTYNVLFQLFIKYPLLLEN